MANYFNMKRVMMAVLVLSLVASGCTKSLKGLNVNPNQPTVVTPNVVLSAALVGTASDMAGDFINLPCWMGYWSRSGNYVPDVQTETYNIANSYANGEWVNMYGNLSNYNYIEAQGRSSGDPFYIGASKVMEAFIFSQLVDAFNNVPYTQAFQVATNVTPKYDDAQTIYNTLVAELDSSFYWLDSAKNFYATTATSVQTNTDAQYDLVYGGTRPVAGNTGIDRLTLWEMFANTVKLKLLMHQSKVAAQQTFITNEIAATSSYGFIGAGEGASVNPGYSASTNKINPFFGQFYTITGSTTTTQNYYRADTYGVNFYLNTNDNRGSYFYSNVGSTIAGNNEGDPLSLPNSSTSAVGPGLLQGYTQDEWIMSDFEALFLEAEAVQRGWISPAALAPAQTLYQSAITQSYVYLYGSGNQSQAMTDAATYYSQPIVDVGWASSPNPLEAILTQKWAALNGINWFEAYCDFRRTGIPNLPITAAPTHLQPQIPVRFLYPQSEQNTNGANVPQLPAQAQFTSKIFWNQ
jgi:hypothetical protein